ncbi:MAG: hypothetical protein IJJ26_13090 [Victivallales bacterium]|nr:hypothetical protein [Victivallales bacterium]
MAIDLNSNGLNNGSYNPQIGGAIGYQQGPSIDSQETHNADGSTRTGATQPLLSGKSVTLSHAGFGDMTRLLMTFQLEHAEKRFQLTSLQFNAILDTLNSMNAITQDQYSQLTDLSLEIETLDAAIKRATKTAADRKKEIDIKEQRKADIENEIVKLEREIEHLEASIAAGTGLSEAEVAGLKSQVAAKNAALKTGKEELVTLNGELVKLNEEMKVETGKVSNLTEQRTAKQKEVAALVDKLDYKAKSLLVENIMMKASSVVQDPEETPIEQEEKEKKEEKIAQSGPLAIVRQQLLEDMKQIQEEREQKIQTIV